MESAYFIPYFGVDAEEQGLCSISLISTRSLNGAKLSTGEDTW
jgi:hypothetical protein